MHFPRESSCSHSIWNNKSFKAPVFWKSMGKEGPIFPGLGLEVAELWCRFSAALARLCGGRRRSLQFFAHKMNSKETVVLGVHRERRSAMKGRAGKKGRGFLGGPESLHLLDQALSSASLQYQV